MKALILLSRRIACYSPRILLAVMLLLPVGGVATPLIPPGDTALRHDLQLLADKGLINTPLTTWPLAWAAILPELEREPPDDMSPTIRDAFLRVAHRARRETRIDYLGISAAASAAAEPVIIRGFANTPREEAGVSADLSWTGYRVSINLSGSVVSSPADGQQFRTDGSMIGLAIGNYSVAVSNMDRWWGPGWDGSLILSNNARPIPSIVLDRISTTPFESRWLNWMGPWDLSVLWGQMESERHIPNARFFGVRFTFKPMSSLEIGLSRTAQWCGEGRPCGVDTFLDLFFGNDNIGGGGVTFENEPGNQMAGFDMRWSPGWAKMPIAFYGQMIGEDEAGGFPSRYLAQFGMEAFGIWQNYSWRWFGELAGTSCDFLKADLYNCAYNQAIYRTGYRYRGRAIGHGADNDAKLFSTGLVLVEDENASYQALLRYGDLNRDGEFRGNTVAPTSLDIFSLDLFHSRKIEFADLSVDVGLGYERLDGDESSSSESRFFVRFVKLF